GVLMLEIKKVRCEYLENPIGIDVKYPRISWQLVSDKRDVMQKAYQIQVADDRMFKEIKWDSDKILSDQSIHIELKGLKVKSCKRYFYRVQAWNQGEESSGWSETSYWETGLLGEEEWQAEWISAPA